MATAWALTLLAFAGIAAGLFLDHILTLSDHLAAIGGGVLFGIASFWVIPEMRRSQTARLRQLPRGGPKE
jgi:hypothetical protein